MKHVQAVLQEVHGPDERGAFAGCFTPDGQAEWEAAGLECWPVDGRPNCPLWEVRKKGDAARLFLGTYQDLWTFLKGYQAGGGFAIQYEKAAAFVHKAAIALGWKE